MCVRVRQNVRPHECMCEVERFSAVRAVPSQEMVVNFQRTKAPSTTVLIQGVEVEAEGRSLLIVIGVLQIQVLLFDVDHF